MTEASEKREAAKASLSSVVETISYVGFKGWTEYSLSGYQKRMRYLQANIGYERTYG